MNISHVASDARVPGESQLVDFLPHLLYYYGATVVPEGSDGAVDMAMYVFDSRSTAERWATISRAQQATECPARRGFLSQGQRL